MAGPQYQTLGGAAPFMGAPGPTGMLQPGPRPVQPMPAGAPGLTNDQPQLQVGNVPTGGASQMPPAQSGPMSFQQRMGGLHPDTMAALHGMPPQAMQQLHSAGLLHPGVMNHINQMRQAGGGGRGGPMTGSSL